MHTTKTYVVGYCLSDDDYDDEDESHTESDESEEVC